MSETNEDVDFITHDETEETSENEFQTPEQDDSQDNGLTPQALAFKNQRAEENRKKREALEEVPKLRAELEKQKFFKKSPDAEDYEKEIDEFRAKNPTIGLEQSFRYVLADLNPSKLAELADPATTAQREQRRTAPAGNERSFSEQTSDNVNPNDMDSLRVAAEKEWARNNG